MGNDQRLMVRNGLVLAMIGFASGFLFLMEIVGDASIMPSVLSLPLDLPGSVSQWRAIHVGTIQNGLMIILVALLLPLLSLPAKTQKLVAWGTVGTGWGNLAFYFFGALSANRGLTIGANRLGEGSFLSLLSFLPGLVFAIVILAVFYVLLKHTAAKS